MISIDFQCPVDGFCNRGRLVHHENFHASLTIANQGFGVDPYACPKSRFNLIFLFIPFFPSSNFVHHRDRAFENSAFVWIGNPSISKSSFDTSNPKEFPKRFSFYFLLSPIALCFLIEEPFLVQPFVCAGLRHPEHLWHLTSDRRGSEQMARHGFGRELKTQAAEGVCNCVSHALDEDQKGTSHPMQKKQITLFVILVSVFFFFFSCLLSSCESVGLICMHFMMAFIQAVMLLRFQLFFTNDKSRTPVNILAPAISAAMAVHAFRRYCIFADCGPSFSVDGFNHNSTSSSGHWFCCSHPNSHVLLSRPLCSLLF